MYIQFACDFDDLKLSQCRIGLYVACTSVIVGWIWLLAIYYQQENTDIDFKVWDMNTATAADYTVQITITKKIWDSWNKKFKNENSHLTFKDYIKQEVIAQVT
jgi:hypothetical protein